MNDKYVLPQAAQDTLGGIKAAAVEDKYTQECRIDKKTGKLYTCSADRFLIEDTFEGNPVMSSSCREGDISLIEGYGESKQITTTGKNLLNFTKETTQTIRLSWGSESGTEIGFATNNVNYSKITQIQVKPNTSYSFYNETYFNFWVSRLIEADDNDFGYVNHAFYGSFTQNKQQYSFTTNEKTTKIFFQVWTPDQTEFKDEYFSQAKIAFYEGNLSYYEPYTGGAPSPSPEYSQEIKSPTVTGIKITDGAEQEQSITLSAPVTLRGIPSETGNVTIDGTKYLSDTIDKEKVTRRIGYIASYNSEDVGDLWMSTTGQLTTGATVIYALSEPITEPLPAEDVQALADLKTFYPTSIISWETEEGSGIWVKTILKQDMKLYIQNKIKELNDSSINQIQNINEAIISKV